MDIRTRTALAELDSMLGGWMDEYQDDLPDLADGAATLLHQVDTIREGFMIAQSVEIELTKMRHPSNRRRTDDR
jgi:hypothetical protein